MPMSLMPGIAQAVTFVAAWGIMMVAMMLPSAIPMIALYGVVHRNAAKLGQKGVSEALFTLVYVAVWLAVGVPVYLASLIISSQSELDDVLPYALAGVL